MEAVELAAQKEDAHHQTRIVGNDRSQRHAENVPLQHQHEEQRRHDVHAVQRDGYPHRCLRVLHADEPAFDGVKPQRGRCRPDAHEEIGQRQVYHMAATLEDMGYRQRDRPLQQDNQQGDTQRNGAGADEYLHRLGPLLGAESLCREATGAHPQESEVPIDEVEDLGADGDGANMVAREVPHNGHIHHSEQRHGDIGHDVWQRQPQNSSVHSSSNIILLCAQFSTLRLALSLMKTTTWLFSRFTSLSTEKFTVPINASPTAPEASTSAPQ